MVRPGLTSARSGPGRLALLLLAGCATPASGVLQAIEVRVAADDPAWSVPLQCEAANAAGRWSFSAPGTVTVRPSASPLRITCQAPAGAVAETSSTAPAASAETREGARKGTATGAKVGAGAGVALGLAAAPLLGPAFALLLAAGGAMRGGEIGGMVGAVQAGAGVAYPSPVVVHIQRAPAPD